jgi:hypothetical protein
MGYLQLSPENQALAKQLVEFASKPENFYRPPSDVVPGERLEYTCHIDSYRCVFTITEIGGARYRHLSISIRGPNLPAPVAAFTLAGWFGFTGAVLEGGISAMPGTDWHVDINEEDNCIILAQEIFGHLSN